MRRECLAAEIRGCASTETFPHRWRNLKGAIVNDQLPSRSVPLPPMAYELDSDLHWRPGALLSLWDGNPDEVRRRLPPVRAYQPGTGSISRRPLWMIHPPLHPPSTPSLRNQRNPSLPNGWKEPYRPRALSQAGLLALNSLAPTGLGLRVQNPHSDNGRPSGYACASLSRMGLSST